MTANNHSLPGSHSSRTAISSENSANPCSSATAQPMRQLLRALQLPSQLGEDVDQICRRHSLRRGCDRLCVEEEIKLQYFFGGQDVAYLTTADGLVIVAAGDLQSASFGEALEALSPDERRCVTLYSPDRWNDPTSALLTVADEA